VVNEKQLTRALQAVRQQGGTARQLSDRILTAGASPQPVTEGRARMLLKELERRGQVERWRMPGVRAWLWSPAEPADS
jgi:hypothetical protein